MRGRVVRIGLGLALCLVMGTACHGMDLRDLPPWLRDMIETVEIDWSARAPAGVGVHLTTPAAGVPAVPSEVHLGSGVGPATAPGDLHTVDTQVLSQAGICLTAIQEQHMSPEEFVQWVQENAVGPKAMAVAYAIASRKKPYWNDSTETICAGLRDAAGDELEHLPDIPVSGRPGLATYLGLQERSEDVKAVLQSMPAEVLDRMQPNTYYLVASTLLTYGKCLRTAIWAWKTEAARRGPMDRALVCLELKMACERLGDPQVAREELIPWGEEALATPGSESQWDRALSALLWAYDYVGEPQKAVERGRYWLQQARERDGPRQRLSATQLRLASVLTGTGQFGQAAGMLRQAIQAGPERAAESAQVELLRLAHDHPDIGPVEILPPKFTRAWPGNVTARVRLGEHTARSVAVRGNPTFKVLRASCTLRFVSPVVGEKRLEGRGAIHEIHLVLKPSQEVGALEGRLVIQTNDAAKPTVDLPITVEVRSPITARPDAFFFGFVNAGETKTATVAVTGTVPFGITDTRVDDAELITAVATRQDNNSYLIKATLRPAAKPGRLPGNIELSTDLASQPRIVIPYYLHVQAGTAE